MAAILIAVSANADKSLKVSVRSGPTGQDHAKRFVQSRNVASDAGRRALPLRRLRAIRRECRARAKKIPAARVLRCRSPLQASRSASNFSLRAHTGLRHEITSGRKRAAASGAQPAGATSQSMAAAAAFACSASSANAGSTLSAPSLAREPQARSQETASVVNSRRISTKDHGTKGVVKSATHSL